VGNPSREMGTKGAQVMTDEDDLIRRGDVLAILAARVAWWDVDAAIRALPAVTPRATAYVQQSAYIDGLRGAANTVRSIRSSVPLALDTVADILDGIAAKAKVDASVKGVQTAHTPRPMKDAIGPWGECECGMTGPCMSPECKAPILHPHQPEGGSDE